MRGRQFILAMLAAVTVLILGQVWLATAASPPPGLTMEAEAAFDGFSKYGEWLPVWVYLENSGPDLQAEIRIRVTGGWGATTYAAPAALPTGSRKRVPVYVLANNFSHELKVELVQGDEVLAGRKIAVKPRPNHSYFVGLLSPERGALSLILGASLPGQERPKELVDLPLSDLPERAEGLRSFDCLVLNDVDTTSLTPGQGASLAAWVRGGGRLVIGGGAGGARAVAGLPEPLIPLAPQGLSELDALPGLTNFGGAEPIRVPGPFVVTTGEAVDGRSLAVQGDLPLVRERSVGRGSVDFVALDLAISPFDAWNGTTAFWEKLLSSGAAYPEWLPPDMSPRQMVSGQMAYALSNLPSLDLPSIRGLGLLLVLYVLLVGPANYLLLRWRKRLHWAWITIPLITVVFSAGAFGLGYALRGSDLVLNKIAVVELQPDGLASMRSYLGLFSPAQQSYEIEVESGGLLAPLNPDLNPWGPGGVNTVSEAIFVQGEPSHVRGLSVNQWSMQTFVTEGMWTGFGRITSELRIEGEKIVGTVSNQTNHTLMEVALVLGKYMARLGDLRPGEEVPVAMDLSGGASEPFVPIGYRLFESYFNQSGSGGPPREVQLKQTVINSVFEQGGPFGPISSVSFTTGSGSPQGLVLLGWLDRAPPDITVGGRKPTQQTTALFYTSLSFHLPKEGSVSVLPGLIPGALIELPLEGGSCGPASTSVFIGRGQATFEFRLPEEIQDVQIDELKLVLRSDGWGQPPDTAIYDWDAGSWLELDDPVMGANLVAAAAGLVSDDGLARVRLSSEDGRGGGCLYVELGLEGKR